MFKTVVGLLKCVRNRIYKVVFLWKMPPFLRSQEGKNCQNHAEKKEKKLRNSELKMLRCHKR